jgi:copper chaperone CopZ
MKKLLATGPLAAMILLLAWVVAGWAPGALAAEEKAATVTSLFKVEGMTCGGCEAGVRMKVKKLVGVEKVEASYETKRARVSYDPKIVTPQRIIAAIKDLGYSAELITDKTTAGGGKPPGRSSGRRALAVPPPAKLAQRSRSPRELSRYGAPGSGTVVWTGGRQRCSSQA